MARILERWEIDAVTEQKKHLEDLFEKSSECAELILNLTTDRRKQTELANLVSDVIRKQLGVEPS